MKWMVTYAVTDIVKTHIW